MPVDTGSINRDGTCTAIQGSTIDTNIKSANCGKEFA